VGGQPTAQNGKGALVRCIVTHKYWERAGRLWGEKGTDRRTLPVDLMGENLPHLVASEDVKSRSKNLGDIQDNRARQPNRPWRCAAIVDSKAQAFVLHPDLRDFGKALLKKSPGVADDRSLFVQRGDGATFPTVQTQQANARNPD
jgi:hypothetical protein